MSFPIPESKNHHSSLFNEDKTTWNDAKYQMKTNNKYWNFYEDRKKQVCSSSTTLIMYVFVQNIDKEATI